MQHVRTLGCEDDGPLSSGVFGLSRADTLGRQFKTDPRSDPDLAGDIEFSLMRANKSVDQR